MHVSDRDILITRDNYHDWVFANERMAKALAAKEYSYQFVFGKNAVHCDRGVKAQTLPLALEYMAGIRAEEKNRAALRCGPSACPHGIGDARPGAR
jgi:hypothetical protein